MKPAIVVTGAASGIGRALALEAARDGAIMVLIDKSQQKLDQIAAELVSGGSDIHALVIDLAEHTAGQMVEDALSERGLYCDVLINSAGFGLFGPASELGRAEQVKLVDVNARAVTELSLRFLPGMLHRRRGGILNVGSITAYTAGPYMALYYASKAFVHSFSSALAAEVAGSGVTVTCLTPGVVRTPFFDFIEVGQTRLLKFIPRVDAAEAAAAGWRGFKAGRRLVFPRLIDRIIASLCAALPDRWLVHWIATLQRPRPPAGRK